MANKKQITIFEGQRIRRVWDDKKGLWYFLVADVVRVLTNSVDAGAYWRKLKQRLREEGSEVVTKCHELKFMANDGKYYASDSADTETMFRIIQSIPSPKAEPFKLWLARVGYERIEEINDPEKALNRSRDYWQRMGRSAKWIQQRMMGQETRNKLTDYWSEHEITKSEEYAILTNIIHQEWSELSVIQHKNLKGLKRENLRDHMTEAELIFSALAEMSTRGIAESQNAKGMDENALAGKKGGGVAKRAREDYEIETSKRAVSGENFLQSPKSGKRLIKK
ncbi:hypothetical protein COX24_00645 [bacterium (Candidatus Gribaldobacteria) CG23_combo_of_CG06-09_8_20_14_all_37_87_8]|uniref:Bro-N domain-containing protein n=1 Tax=bacterium (Candidatus Gribaldobacteria) CG23_combo_of_CG06-09_8_20_14_all_37_87_8 TaxID=2014278 RepID=A0A2G9ZI03_9BACT|nr:MAG: hypothetical protein COX24_00645 [bacterium (Candidatus Gribaldobacteria) CG23_combo_of_CG06-09_8_20_14_all_37_87_8]